MNTHTNHGVSQSDISDPRMNPHFGMSWRDTPNQIFQFCVHLDLCKGEGPFEQDGERWENWPGGSIFLLV